MPFEIDTTGVESMVRELAVFAGHGSNTEQALLVTTGKILDTAIRYTPMSTQAELVERVTASVNLDFARYDLLTGDGVLTTNQGRRGTLLAGTQWVREGGVNYIMKGGNPRRWSAARWGRYQAANAQREADLAQSLRIRVRKAQDSVGLTRQSWVDIADDLGIELHSPRLAKIRAAVASDGRAYKNGQGYAEADENGLTITIENAMPVLIRQGGAAILQRAIDTRLSAFATDMKKGVFQDLENFARRYKGLDISLN